MSLDQLGAELFDLHRLYLSSRALVKSAQAAGIEIDSYLTPGDILKFPGSAASVDANAISSTFKKHTRTKKFLESIRALILIRAVSALETFFVDTIRTAFLLNRAVFHKQDRRDFAVAELLSYSSIEQLWGKLIEQDCRRLTSGGFKEFGKYFKGLSVEFSRFQSVDGTGLSALEETIDRRHLLVHRLGNTDKEYRDRYNVQATSIKIGETYLMAALRRIGEFGRYVWSETMKRCDVKSKYTSDPRVYRSKMTIICLDRNAMAVFAKEYMVDVDTGTRVDDIIESMYIHDDEIVMTLACPQKLAIKFWRIIKRLQKRQSLLVRGREVMSIGHACKLDDEQLKEIATALPGQPWPVGLHKNVALQFGISKTQSNLALHLIKNFPDRYGYLDGAGTPVR